MKKFLFCTLCTIFASSVFAEAFSVDKLKTINDFKDKTQYAYESQVSNNSTLGHMQLYFIYLKNNQVKLTADQLIKHTQKFQKIKNYEDGLGIVYAMFGFEKEAIAQYNKTKNMNIINRLYIKYKNDKNFDKCWQYGTKLLTQLGGFNNPNKCTDIIHIIFRYKPTSITKEEQIKFLEQIVQIYPIPGTDFNQWKNFMGFVGFKYKTLTGKELF